MASVLTTEPPGTRFLRPCPVDGLWPSRFETATEPRRVRRRASPNCTVRGTAFGARLYGSHYTEHHEHEAH